MEPDVFKSLRDWLDEAKAATEGRLGDVSGRIQDALTDAAARLEQRLDDLDAKRDDAFDHDAGKPSTDSEHVSHSESQSESSSSKAADPASAPAAAATVKPVSIGVNPIKVGVAITASPAKHDVNFKMATKAFAGGSGKNDVSVSSKVQSSSSRPDKLDVKVAVAEWAKDPGDGGTLDFLLLVSGGKSGSSTAPEITRKQAKDVDLVLNINLKGLPLQAKVKADGLKAVKIGDDGAGYLGQANDDGHTIKVVLSPAKGGAPVAVLALDIQADGAVVPHHLPDLFV